jgi:Rha family phage regulatory protein
MNQLVIQQNGNPVTTSRLVAGKFGKRHTDVMKAIRNLDCSEDFRLSNFAHTPYVHEQNGQTYSEYIMTKDGFYFLGMGFTGKEAAKFKEEFIYAFNAMESQLKERQTPALVTEKEVPFKTLEMLYQLANVVSDLSDKVNILTAGQQLPQAIEQEEYLTIKEYSRRNDIVLQWSESAKIAAKAGKYAGANGIILKQVPHEKYGSVRSYPVSVLDKVFKDNNSKN